MSNKTCIPFALPSLEKFKNVFGKPREGLHSYRIPYLDVAIVDVAGTLGLAWLLAKFLGLPSSSIPILFLQLFFVGMVLHSLFGVGTRLEKVMEGVC